MFDALTKGFRQARNRLAGLTELTEQNIEAALREVRLSACSRPTSSSASSRRSSPA